MKFFNLKITHNPIWEFDLSIFNFSLSHYDDCEFGLIWQISMGNRFMFDRSLLTTIRAFIFNPEIVPQTI